MATYTVVAGDTMWKIANDHGITLAALIAANPQISDPNMIQVGQVLNIPQTPAENHPAPAPGNPAPAPVPDPPTGPPPSNPAGIKTVAYFTNWGIYGRNYQPQDIPANHITHILYSFANIRGDSGEVHLTDTYADLEKHYPSDSWDEKGNNAYGCVKQLFLLKKRHRHLKVLLSIGGWTYSSNFRAAATPDGRRTFARSAVKLLADCGFDGIDIDWEYPQDDAEAQNYVSLLNETRVALDEYASQNAHGKHFLLTIAAPCGPNNYSKLRIAEMDRYLDFWNLMCYDFSGSWDSVAGHMANVYQSQSAPNTTPFNADAAVSAYISAGVHPSKIIFGLPLYGRAFENTQGPGSPFQGVGQGSWENGVWDYKALPQAGSQEENDTQLLASWSYSSSAQKMISYDTPSMAQQKAGYILHRGLGGAMWWELSGDHPVSHERSLINVTVSGLGGTAALDGSENMLDYPTSVYDNVKNKFE
ncbi:Chitinase 4 [Emydomyces testavorans]|uniref:Endochitinase 1 n=1 Tax=Emydomyces testavorans TaxID=2070801 RepID=A0AAF0DGL4_9EURO|nr:Chitinase 4 [Emydomyces testavorans]